MAAKKPKVLVGMSGGVDSSVAAALLLEAGYEVIGAFMKNWSDCAWREDRRDAMRVAAKLGIEFYTFDFEQAYRDEVVENMYREYEAGRTPNPDVMCNRYIKFDKFLKKADELGCDFIATGHYARIDCPHQKDDGRGKFGAGENCRILSGVDSNKDQTYFLWAVPKEAMARALFPVGEMTKPEVRAKAEKLGLSTAAKKDSQGICFIGEVDLMEFLKERIKPDPGSIVDTEGRKLGEHEGLAYYTIGQRHGLEVGGGTPYYVVAKRPETKELVVSSNYHPELYEGDLEATELNWFVDLCSGTLQGSSAGRLKPSSTCEFDCEARIRYRQPLQKCHVEFESPLGALSGKGPKGHSNTVRVTFKNPQRAVTPGQSIVFYQGDQML
ncbi:MAG: tRNA 2-thiouridine(34) synthase MnmA, partial [Candidatus Uhrbacteria bacterium]